MYNTLMSTGDYKVLTMNTKAEVLKELETLIKEKGLAKSTVGRIITNDPTFVDRLRNPKTDIKTKTLDATWRYILQERGQLKLDL
tara:strand:- start:3615 stop:3869 length:255 start_codon:yes stop_codon:yes gene_type:complete